MPTKPHSRKKFARGLQAAIAGVSCWALHAPKMHEMVEIALQAHMPGLPSVKAQFGQRDDDPSRMERVGTVAVIPIVGMIRPTSDVITRYFGGTSLELVERDYRAAQADPQIRNIVLFVDSYGGSAAGNDELSRLIYSTRDRKPVYAFIRGGCASAGYFIGSSASKIVASSSSLVGGIGTIAVHQEYADLFKEMGVGNTVITYGDKKGHGNTYEKLTPEGKATLQKMVNDFGAMFTAAVARNRGVTAEVVNSTFGQGEAFVASEALARGMIDQVADWPDFLSQLQGVPAQQSSASNLSNQPESAPAAGASAASVNPPPAQAAASQEFSMDPRIKAMLFARGLISTVDANDEECKVALRSYFAGRNESQPSTPEAVMVALAPVAPASNATPATATAPPPAVPATGAAVTTPTVDAATAERTRVLDLQAAAPTFGIDAAGLQTAISSGQSYETVVAGWSRAMVQTHQPVSGGARVTSEGAERFMIDASNAIALKAGCTSIPQAARTESVVRMSRAPLMFFAEQCLQQQGVRYDRHGMTAEEIAELALASNHSNRVNIGNDSGAFNRPGDFPGMLSNLTNTMFQEGIERSEAMWPEWTGTVADDIANFHPAPMPRLGETDQMDEVLDDEAFKELKIVEELLGYMQLARYGNHIKLTPVMVAQDQPGKFREKAWNLSGAWWMTINRLCLSILTGNPTLLDGVALFDSNDYPTGHQNVITSGGGAPSYTTWQAMQLKYWKQQTVGQSGYQSGRLSVALVPPNWDQAAEQTFLRLSDLLESKQAVTDATINNVRGKVKHIVEPELQRSSDLIWFGLADPRLRPTVKVGFFKGWGRNGKRERWYDPTTKSQCFSLEGRVGVAPCDFRTVVRNPGQ